jgi:polyisoprenoid-binding protein YceI
MTPPVRLFSVVTLLAACSRETASSTPPEASARAPAGPSAVAAAPSGSAAAPSGSAAARAAVLPVRQGKATFLIDAPLEKIRGEVSEARGEVRLDAADLGQTRGEVSFRVTTLRTLTFGEAGKDESQTDHARNWLQVGSKSEAADRQRYEWATFRVMAVEVAAPPGGGAARLADLPAEADGSRVVRGKAVGDLSLHGVTRSHTIAFTARVSGPAAAPTGLVLTTERPLDLSLKDHAVEPRDEIGSLLAGALEKIGKKISDRVQVSLEVKAGS